MNWLKGTRLDIYQLFLSGILFTTSLVIFHHQVHFDTVFLSIHSATRGCAISYLRAPGDFFKACRSGAFEVIEFQMIPVLSGIRSARDRYPYIYSVVDEKALPALYRGLSLRNMATLAPVLSSEIVEQLDATLKAISGSDEVSLQYFVQRTLYSAVSKAFLGPNFPISNFVEFGQFDEGVPYIFQKRSYMAPRALRAREVLVKDWTRFVYENWRPDQGGYLDGASDVVSHIVRILKTSQLTNDEVVRLMNGLFWGTHTNVIRATTWALCYLLTNQDFMILARDEIKAVVEVELTNDLNALLQLGVSKFDSKFPFVTSLVKEVLRTKMLPVSVREAMEDVVIHVEEGTILIPKGDIVIADIQSLHHDPDVHSSPETFKADRFVDEDGLKRSKTLNFFGGGRHTAAIMRCIA
ncbi:cytochrome P450 [Cyathus striatus]|nr:cytochrome P450 [Cyathus striatus]